MNKLALAFAFLASAPILALGSTVSAEAPPTKEFVERVAISDMFEIESGELATKQAENEAVRAFGQQMVKDHQKTTQELKQVVETEAVQVRLPASIDKEHRAKLDQLRSLSGPKFDQTYVSMQVDAHQQAVSLFEAYAEGGDDPDLRQWAKNTLPALKDHLKQAKDLNSELKTAEAEDGDREPRSRHNVEAEQSKQEVREGQSKRQPPATRARTFEFVQTQKPTDWSAEALIGRTVENHQGDDLGAINNVIINEEGDVVAVTIGVGGFLGIGQKDVGVPFEALEFVPEERMADSGAARPQENQETRNGYGVTRQQEKQTQNGAPQDDAAARYDAEHSNVRIFLNATREQLEAAPEFAWLGQ